MKRLNDPQAPRTRLANMVTSDQQYISFTTLLGPFRFATTPLCLGCLNIDALWNGRARLTVKDYLFPPNLLSHLLDLWSQPTITTAREIWIPVKPNHMRSVRVVATACPKKAPFRGTFRLGYNQIWWLGKALIYVAYASDCSGMILQPGRLLGQDKLGN